ncbi:phosphotransferase enzyme family protein [Nostoc sp. PA-18-2419]|uniref:phosphotransferase enzyme family protein n=1 Tax=Nostoc sp. PA-18-2419 TaxID=2575443 RepID=UPI00110A061B|nr:phosphotransferase [Nostoc sp. PA-18-2419]
MHFTELNHDGQLRQLEKRVAQAIAGYPLYGVRYRLLQYEDNAVYRLTDGDGKDYVLRLGALAGHDSARQLSEMKWLEWLGSKAKFPVPLPVVNCDGQLVTDLPTADPSEPHLAVVLRWVEGEHPSPPIEPTFFSQLGEITGHMHLLATHFSVPVGFVRPSWDWHQLFGPFSVFESRLSGGGSLEVSSVPLEDAQLNILASVRNVLLNDLHKLRSSEDAWGLIHGDLHRDNILIHDGETGVIDFDDCGWGFFLYDVASVLDSTYRRLARNLGEYQQLRDAYLTSYDRIRPLPTTTSAQLMIFKAMRDLVTLNFILSSTNSEVLAWGPPRVQSIMEQLNAYLDGSSRFCI